MTTACGGNSSDQANQDPQNNNQSNSEENSSEELPILGVSIYSAADNFVSYIGQSISNTSKGIFQVNVEDGQNDQTNQLNQVDTMIARGAKVIALALVDTTAAPAVIEKAKEAGNLPVIFFNNKPDDKDLLSYDNVYFAGNTGSDWGAIIQGEMVAKAFKENPEFDKNGDGKIQLVNIMGDPGHAATAPRAEYAKKAINDAGLEYELLAEDTGMWATANAKDKMDAWISKFGDEIEFIITANDAMALGALTSIQAVGYNTEGADSEKYIPIIGIDALPEILSKIETGEVQGSVLQDAKTQGEVVVKMAANLANGKDPLDGMDGFTLDESKCVDVPYKAIDISNIEEAKAGY